MDSPSSMLSFLQPLHREQCWEFIWGVQGYSQQGHRCLAGKQDHDFTRNQGHYASTKKEGFSFLLLNGSKCQNLEEGSKSTWHSLFFMLTLNFSCGENIIKCPRTVYTLQLREKIISFYQESPNQFSKFGALTLPIFEQKGNTTHILSRYKVLYVKIIWKVGRIFLILRDPTASV